MLLSPKNYDFYQFPDHNDLLTKSLYRCKDLAQKSFLRGIMAESDRDEPSDDDEDSHPSRTELENEVLRTHQRERYSTLIWGESPDVGYVVEDEVGAHGHRRRSLSIEGLETPDDDDDEVRVSEVADAPKRVSDPLS